MYSIELNTEELEAVKKYIRQKNITKPNGSYISIQQAITSRIKRAIYEEVMPYVK